MSAISRYAVIAAVALMMALFPFISTAEPDQQRQNELRYLLKQDCGSCHGMTLKGGLGPELTPARMQTLSEDFLVAVIRYGRPGTPMPPWDPILSPDDIRWLAKKLRGETQ